MKKKYSYISLLTDDTYSYGIILLVMSLRAVKSKYPLHLLVTPNVSAAILELLNQLQVTYEITDIIEIPEEIYNYNKSVKADFAATWKYCWTKFKIFNLTQFDKVVFLDADIMAQKNLDHLFEKPHMTAAVDGEYFNIWPEWMHFNAGCLVVEPKEEEYNKILEFARGLKVKDLPKQQIAADQEILNLYYKNWESQTALHLNKYYNIFAPYIQEDQIEDIEKNAYFIHFIGRKPWEFWVKNPLETYTEHFYVIAKKQIELQLAQFDWQKIRDKLVITVYSICKDERQNVERFINSFGKAEHLCILDTGSTDGTWEYLQEEAKKRPNLIVDQKIINPWRFDRARDESMKLIPKDTSIFFMADLDEEIREEDWPARVKKAWDPIFSRMMYDYHRDLDDNGNVIRTIKEYRIHSKDWTHWVNIVHEAICTEAGEKRFYMEFCNPVDIEVWHYAKNIKKNYAELCEEDLKEKPDDWIMRLQLAIEYELDDEFDKAEEHYSYILSHPNNLQPFEVARCFNGIARNAKRKGNIRLAQQYYTEGRLACDYFADNYIEPMEIYYNENQYTKVIELGRAALDKCTEAQWCSNYDLKNYYPYYLMGITYWQLKEIFKAIGYVQYAYTRNPSDEIKKVMNQFCELTASAFNENSVDFDL